MPNLGRTQWWWGFGLLIAAPTLVLAVLGLRSVNLQDTERRHQLDEQQGQAAFSLDTALGAALSRIEEPPKRNQPGSANSSPQFTLSLSGELRFSSDKILFSDSREGPPLRVPPALPAPLRAAVDEGLAAEAQSDYPHALDVYQRLARSRELTTWGRLGVARIGMRQRPSVFLDWVNSLQASDSVSLTPDGTPVLLLAAGYAKALPPAQASAALPFLRSTLTELRSGRWWLDYQQRKLYDFELCALISTSAGSAPVEDSRLNRIGVIERAIRRAAPFRRDSPSRLTIGDSAATVLLVVNPETGDSAGWRGTAISGPDLSALAEETLGPIAKTFSFPLALADPAGHSLWGKVSGGIPRTLPLRAVPGWQLLVGEPLFDSGRFQRSLWYGFLALLLAMLVFGLAMTDRLVRREVELARLQAEFAAGVTHEFKSPLTGLRLLMERIGSGRLLSQESFREYLSAMRRETDRLDHLVNRLLETHRIQSGQKHYQIAPHCITDIAQTAAARLRTQAEAKKITVTVDSDDPTREIDVDRTALQDSLENLLENAIKYSPSGTSVALTIRHGDRDLFVSVRDQGLGIDPADLPRIFDRFYRGRRTASQAIPGTGLGLALVKAVAEGHGGAVEVESAPGGSEFRLRIPIREEETYVAGPDRG